MHGTAWHRPGVPALLCGGCRKWFEFAAGCTARLCFSFRSPSHHFFAVSFLTCPSAKEVAQNQEAHAAGQCVQES